MIGLARALSRFRALPDDTGIALERNQRFARVSPILKLLDSDVVAGLPPGTAAEDRPRDIDHVPRTLACIEQRPRRAALLSGAAHALHAAIGAPPSPAERAMAERFESHLPVHEDEELAAAWAEGRAMDLERVFDVALDR